MHKFRLSGKDWYLEKNVVRQLGVKNVKELREKFAHFTYYALSVNQREQLIDAGLAPKCIRSSGVLVSCDDVDPYLDRIEREASAVPHDCQNEKNGKDADMVENTNSSEVVDNSITTEQIAMNDSTLAEQSSPGRYPLPSPVEPSDGDFLSHVKLEPSDQSHEPCTCNCSCSGECATGSVAASNPDNSDKSNCQPTPSALSSSSSKRRKVESIPFIKEEKKFICGCCSFHVEFPSEDGYLRHMLVAHGRKMPRHDAKLSLSDTVAKVSQPSKFLQSESLIKCVVCSVHFDSMENLRLHQQLTQHLYSFYSCKCCSTVCLSEAELDLHVKKTHPTKENQLASSYKCILEGCNARFAFGEALCEHVARWHKNKLFICGTCFTMFRYPEALGFHLKSTRHFAPKSYDYSDDEGSTSSKKQNWRPRGPRKYSCDTCRKSFDLSLSFLIHKKLCTPAAASAQDPVVVDNSEPEGSDEENGTFYTCTWCNAQFNKRKELHVHQYQHRTFKCDQCPKAFFSHTTLWSHKKSHINNGMWLRCEFCPKTFREHSTYERHLDAFHPQEKAATWTFRCDICDKPFKTETSLKIHRHWHNRDGYKCGTNLKTEEKPSPMKEESRVMTSASPVCEDQEIDNDHRQQQDTAAADVELKRSRPRVSCSLCDKTFNCHSYLEDHMAAHNNLRPYKCEKCGKSFTYSSAYCAHKKKPCDRADFAFSCPSCGDFFKTNSSLATHITRIHSNDEEICHVCGENIIGLKNMQSHIHLRHPEVPSNNSISGAASATPPPDADSPDDSCLYSPGLVMAEEDEEAVESDSVPPALSNVV